jgi:hypothetical protein
MVAYKFLNMVVVEQPRATNSIEDIDIVVDCGKQSFRIVSHEQSEFTERSLLVSKEFNFSRERHRFF